METPKLVCDETNFGSESHAYSEPKFESETLMCTEQSVESPTRLVSTERCLESASLKYSEEQCSQPVTLAFQKSEPASIVCKELDSELNTIASTERVFEPASFVGTEQALELALLHHTDQTLDSENRKSSEEGRISVRSQADSSVASFPGVVAQEVVIVESSHVSVPAARDLGMLKDDRVLRNLLISEDKCPANPASYFMFQEDIKPFMRRIVAMWMLEVRYKIYKYIATYFQHISYNIRLRTHLSYALRSSQESNSQPVTFVLSVRRSPFPFGHALSNICIINQS